MTRSIKVRKRYTATASEVRERVLAAVESLKAQGVYPGMSSVLGLVTSVGVDRVRLAMQELSRLGLIERKSSNGQGLMGETPAERQEIQRRYEAVFAERDAAEKALAARQLNGGPDVEIPSQRFHNGKPMLRSRH